ncbi:MAG: NAD(P)H-dependent glycerol-3-phosphate dehydrogenase [Bacilli bacterium]
MKITILGSGAWGTSLAHVFADNGHQVLIYGIEEAFNVINTTHISPIYPDKILSDKISFTTVLDENTLDCDVLVFSVPSKAYRSVARSVNSLLQKKTYIVSTAKGFDPDTQERLSSVLRSEIQAEKRHEIVSLIGPSYASEVMADLITAVSAVCISEDDAKFVQKVLSNEKFRIYTNTDEIGCECSAALKNVIAIASGIVDGMKQGSNARAALVTRGIAEIKRFSLAMGSKEDSFLGLTGIGDLMLTCNSMQSRNFYIGHEIGRLDDAEIVLQQSTSTTEGVFTSKFAYLLSQKLNIEMPITEACYLILFEGLKPSEMLPILMNRTLKAE